jgi:solute carrier family 41
MGGLILSTVVQFFNGFVVFQPIINGVGGNLVSVQASKISTMLHQGTIFGEMPSYTKILEVPWRALFGKSNVTFFFITKISLHGFFVFKIFSVPYAKTARILIVMMIPSAILFIFLADFIHMNQSTIGAPFVFSYLFVSLIQVSDFFQSD